jgi:phosphopantetheinyl transferase
MTSATVPGSVCARLLVSPLRSLTRTVADAESCLSEEEERRASRFYRLEDAMAFRARRAFLRRVLGRELSVSPLSLPLDASGKGQPVALCAGGPTLHFSQSSTKGWTAVALSWDAAVGVDIEVADLGIDHAAMARRWFTAGEAQPVLRARSRRRAALEFLRVWTAREAAAKATGEGMACAIPHHVFCAERSRVVSDDGREVLVDHLVAEGWVLAVARAAGAHGDPVEPQAAAADSDSSNRATRSSGRSAAITYDITATPEAPASTHKAAFPASTPPSANTGTDPAEDTTRASPATPSAGP